VSAAKAVLRVATKRHKRHKREAKERHVSNLLEIILVFQGAEGETFGDRGEFFAAA
jgi:hypothetical protein